MILGGKIYFVNSLKKWNIVEKEIGKITNGRTCGVILFILLVDTKNIDTYANVWT